MATAARKPFPPIPYGMADFSAIRREGFLYVDKTRFLRDLEDDRHVFLLRPRRFGKSCWVSILERYYARAYKDGFDALFAGTDIGDEPTPNRSQYAVLRLNFSAFGKELSTLRESFEVYCHTQLRGMLEVNADLFPTEFAQRILSPPTMGGRLNELFFRANQLGVRLYLLIDEYDNFANTILAGEGQAAYHAMTHGSGWFRDFFATLKAGTESGNLERLFITGVSPVTMDDVTSGFNIGKNISFDAIYNQMVGFTEKEVRDLVTMYHGKGVLDQEPEAAMAVMREWYNGYRFAEDADEDLYNTDMVLYYLDHSIPNKRGPRYLIDANVRVDYAKLRHLVVVNREMVADRAATPAAQRAADAEAGTDSDPPRRVSSGAELRDAKALGLNGNFDVLRQVIAEGRVDSDLIPSFPVEQLGLREHFVTLLHCFGPALHPRRSRRAPAVRRPEPDRAAADVRLPARRLPRHRRVLRGSPGVREPHLGHGARRRLAAGGGPSRRRPAPADRGARLRAGRAPAAGLLRRLPGRRQLLRVPHGTGTFQRLRGHGADAAGRPLSDPAPRLRGGTQVPQAHRRQRRESRRVRELGP